MTESQLVDELCKRLGVDEESKITRTDVRKFIKAFKEEVTECLVMGYKVSLSGLVRFEPRYVPEKPKGVLVRNPATGESAPRAKAVPASFKAKAFASSTIKRQFPTIRSAAGKTLANKLGAKA